MKLNHNITLGTLFQRIKSKNAIYAHTGAFLFIKHDSENPLLLEVELVSLGEVEKLSEVITNESR